MRHHIVGFDLPVLLLHRKSFERFAILSNSSRQWVTLHWKQKRLNYNNNICARRKIRVSFHGNNSFWFELEQRKYNIILWASTLCTSFLAKLETKTENNKNILITQCLLSNYVKQRKIFDRLMSVVLNCNTTISPRQILGRQKSRPEMTQDRTPLQYCQSL